ncbi:MFS transporter [Nocardia sp. NPDC056952]|uniref:MFS transporter n=1 Tax=Nocardia sp. NPDC056952 TaxID=3345979 RepID=UPI00364517F3
MTSTATAANNLPRDFHILWRSATVSQIGTSISAGAIPLIAILTLKSSDLSVSLLSTIAGVASAAVALPLGSYVEFNRKVPTMVYANLLACTAMATIPIAMWLHILTYAQLCAVISVHTVCSIVLSAASTAYIKSIVSQHLRVSAMGRFETMFQSVSAIVTPMGGAVVTLVGAGVAVLGDAVSYLLAALGLRSIRTSETQPPHRAPHDSGLRTIRSGWTHIAARPLLRLLLVNATLFGGAIMMATPLLALLMLRELGFSPWQYGLVLGLPGISGVLGSLSAARIVALLGESRALFGLGALRTLWLGPVLLAPPSMAGMVLMVASISLLMFCAGAFNPVFITYRMNFTADDYIARVSTAWSITAKWSQPLFAAAGGAIAAAANVRTAIAVAAALLVASAMFLPWRSAHAENCP